MSEPLRVAMIGHGFMGAAHSQAWRVAPRFFDLPRHPEMNMLVGRQLAAARTAATHWGWTEVSTDWRAVIERNDIDVIDIVTPGDTHAEMAIAALAAGKHVLCEKPLANSVPEAEAMADAAKEAWSRGIHAMVGFSYRRFPSTAFARQLVASGRIGEVRQVRAEYLQDWLADAEAPLTWRLEKSKAGSGALGDIGAHAIDLAEYVTGLQLTAVSGIVETLVSERPVMGEQVGLSGTATAVRGRVTVDDVALFHGRFDSGALGSFEATRFRTGRKNAFRLEVSGSEGALAFDFERMNELELYDGRADPMTSGFQRIMVTEHDHPYMAPWWPTGHGLGYEHGFTHQVADFVCAVHAGEQPSPSFSDGLHIQRVLAAVEDSSTADSVWTAVDGSSSHAVEK